MRKLGLFCLAGLLGARMVEGQHAPRRPWALGLEDVSPIGVPPAIRAQVEDLEYADTDSIRGVVVDLNADGAPEYLLQSAPSLCGNGGCLYTLVDGKSGQTLGQFFGNVVYVQTEMDQGFPRLATYSHLSVASGTYATYAFDGHGYGAPSTRTLEGGALDSLAASLRQIPFWHPGRWPAAARTIRRLPPDSFPQLPGAIRSALAARGCTVPQSLVEGRPHNVISGRFAPAQQRDWAVLCSRHDSSSVLVFWGGRGAVSPDELGWTADAGFLQDTGAGRIGYSRAIAVATPERIRAYVGVSGGPLPRPLDHDGIEDAFAEKASTVLYWEKGRWMSLTGAD